MLPEDAPALHENSTRATMWRDSVEYVSKLINLPGAKKKKKAYDMEAGTK